MSDTFMEENRQDMDWIKTQIDAEQEKINEAYTQIGKAYYEGHTTDYDPAYESYYASIKASYQTVLALHDQILASRGLRLCPSCGSEMPRDIHPKDNSVDNSVQKFQKSLACKISIGNIQ